MNCCTPEYIKINISPTGDLIVERNTGNYPSCGYYSNYTGSASIGNLDRHEVDVNYDSGNGYWTFSGNTEAFSDTSIYRSTTSGNPCNPIGNYTGGLYNVIISESNRWDTYDFEPSFTLNTGQIGGVSIGSGIHKKKDVNIDFSFIDKKRNYISTSEQIASSKFIDSIVYDILDINGTTQYENYQSGIDPSISITEQQNIEIFGSYQKDFGIRAKTIDPLIGVGGVSEYYVYGNVLNINSIEVRDVSGTTNYMATSYAEKNQDSVNLGTTPSGFVGEDEENLAFQLYFDQNKDYVNPVSVYIYANTGYDFETSEEYLLGDVSVSKDLNLGEFLVDDLTPGVDHWFKMTASSELGYGNTVTIGPHKIFSKEKVDDSLLYYKYDISDYRDKETTISQTFSVGSIYDKINNNSGVLDTLSIDLTKTGLGTYVSGEPLYSQEVLYGFSLPINENGKWVNTTFDYEFQFKNSSDDYQNILKNVKITATGTSADPFNQGLPLFQILDLNTGTPVEVGINYIQSGIEIVANTGHVFDLYKYYKKTI